MLKMRLDEQILVIFGLNDNSSLGIDSSLGEVNIFGSPWDSLDKSNTKGFFQL